LIAGGSEKNSNFSELARVLAETSNLKALILLGPSGQRIKKLYLAAGGLDVLLREHASSMEEIFRQIAAIAETGDTVLLSPGAASFGMFTDYKDRGNQFKKAAQNF
jgi:UDP-N-acetylmuramoylalanine--D-glutamate ligase